MTTHYLDVETVAAPMTLWRGIELTQRRVPANYSKPESIDRWVRDNLADTWRRQSLSALRGRVLCIGYARDDDDPVCIWRETEPETLQTLQAWIAATPGDIVTFNGSGFDIPFLRQRALVWHCYQLARRLLQPKPWSPGFEDARDMWAMPARPQQGRLDDIAEALGIDRSANPIGGSEVLDRYLAGDLEAIRAHVLDDVHVLREVHRRLRRGAL